MTTPAPPNAQTLPSGIWVTIRDPKTITERQRRLVENQSFVAKDIIDVEEVEKARESGDKIAMMKAITAPAQAEFAKVADIVCSVFVESWSLEVPIEPDAMLDLTGGDYHALQEIVTPLYTDLFLNVEPTPDKNSPTSP